MASITWLQRCAIAVELCFAWLFWRSIGSGAAVHRWDIVPRAMGAAGAIVVLGFCVAFATFPGEAFETNWIEGGTNWIVSLVVSDKDRPLSHLLFGGTVNEATGSTSSLFANRLILPGEKFYEGDDAKGGTPSVSLRGRDLSHAILQNADLRFADFRGANLSGADLYQARLDGARFDCPGKIVLRRVTDAKPAEKERRGGGRGFRGCSEAIVAGTAGIHRICAHRSRELYRPAGRHRSGRRPRAACVVPICRPLHANFAKNDFSYVSFEGADLQNAKLIKANLREDTFAGADLRGAVLTGAQASGGLFTKAKLQGAHISSAELWGADFAWAWMQGADAQGADLDGSIFTGARLEGASFDAANLKSVKMNVTQAQGASFKGADLTAAILIASQFQGADFTEATLDLATFGEANLYRTRFGVVEGTPMFQRIDLSNGYPKLRSRQQPPGFVKDSEPSQLDANGFADLKTRATYGVVAPPVVKSIRERLAALDPTDQSQDKAPEVLAWRKLSPTRDTLGFSRRRKGMFVGRMCAPEGAPYVARFLIKELSRFAGFREAMALRVKDIAKCPGAKGLTDEDLEPLAR